MRQTFATGFDDYKNHTMEKGRIIILNGTSSAGKSMLAAELRRILSEPFCYYASDQLADAGFRAIKHEVRDVGSPSERDKFFEGFHRSIVGFAEAGNDLIIEHIVEEASWWAQLQSLLTHIDTFWVGVHAPITEIERRERERGDRTIGEAAYHLKTHQYCRYDIEVNTSDPLDAVAAAVMAAWSNRPVFKA